MSEEAAPNVTLASLEAEIKKLNVSAEAAIVDGNVSFILMCTALVLIMTPGLGYFYSGMARSKNALSLIFLACLSLAVVSIQWYFWGYSLALAPSENKFIGDLRWIALHNVDLAANYPDLKIPNTAFFIYQCMFAAITPALAFGAAAERSRIPSAIVFLLVWSTLVYDFIAYWTWAGNGWLNHTGGIIKAYDFAGGGPVHISSGMAALAYAIALGKRQGHGQETFRPHNIANVFLGTALLWFGWLGFNGGSALAANARAANAIVVTNISAAFGGITWVLLDYRHNRKWSALGFCCGAVAGLVCITPGSGYVSPASSIVFGVVGAIACNFAGKVKTLLGFDDALDVFAVHGVGGIVGGLLTGIFAQKSIAALDEQEISGGWLDQNYIQLAYQIVAILASAAWSFVITFILLKVIDLIPGLSLRLKDHKEELGVDISELGEVAYDHVYLSHPTLANQVQATSAHALVDPIVEKVVKADAKAAAKEEELKNDTSIEMKAVL